MKGMKSMKKAFAMFLAFCVLLSSAGITAFADTGEDGALAAAKAVQQEKQIGPAPYYELDDDHNISGAGVESSYVEAANKFVEAWKDIKATGMENVFDITLKVTTKEQIDNLTKPENAAVMLIMDESGSMAGKITVNGTKKSKNEFAQDAAKSFIEDYIDGAGDAVRMLSVIKFSTDATRVLGWTDMVKSTGSAIDAINDVGTEGNTNIEGALMLARNNIVDGKTRTPENGGILGISRVYVILLTDGQPTAYIKTANTDELINLEGSYLQNDSAPDVAYKGINNKFTSPKKNGLAFDLKSNITSLYTIAFDTEGQKLTITKDYSKTEEEQKNISTAKWLEDYVASKGCAKNAGNDVGLAFKNIATEIAKLAKAWIITDPMSDYVEFDKDYSSEIKVDSSDSAAEYSTADDTLHWDLKKVEPKVIQEGNTKTYHYELTYRVKLKTELLVGLDADVFPTNKKTNLTYLITEKENDSVTSVEGNIDLLVPAVKPAYTVEYSYWVKNGGSYERVEGYTKAESADGFSGFMEGDKYTIGEDNVYTPYPYGNSDYQFVYATNTDRDSAAYTLADAKGYASGTIAKANVKINLYYINEDGLRVGLTKKIKKDCDETWPAEFTFDFVLTNEAGKEVTNPLTMIEADFAGDNWASGTFIWASGINFKEDVLGQTLKLSETTSIANGEGTWNSSVGNGVPYVKIAKDGSMEYLNLEGGLKGVVINDYEQTPVSAQIDLRKFFAGSPENFKYHEIDGAALVCDWELHEHILPSGEELGCYKLVCDIPEHDPATCEKCIAADPEDPCELAYHVHSVEAGCYELDCAYADKDTHEHGDACWKYTFTFTLYTQEGNPVNGVDPIVMTLSAAEIKNLLENPTSSAEDFFIIPANLLPAAQGWVTYTIKETEANYEGWTSSQEKTVQVNRLGEVEYINNDGYHYVKMTNSFEGEEAPGLSFTKEVINGRSDDKGQVKFNGTFNFKLLDVTDGTENPKLVKEITLEIKNGKGQYTIELPEYRGKDAILNLTEVSGSADGKVTDEDGTTIDGTFDYDGHTCVIVIENGAAAISTGEDAGANFVNSFYMGMIPDVLITKDINRDDKNGKFKFNINYGEGSDKETMITTEKGYGEDTFTLPPNYTGTVTVSEALWIDDKDITSSEPSNWLFDDTRYEFEYDHGVLMVGRYLDGDKWNDIDVAALEEAIAKFANSYVAPIISLEKTADKTSVAPNGIVKYKLISTNTGSEALKEVVIVDSMLKNYNGTLTVTKVFTDPGQLSAALEIDKDYGFDKAAGSISIFADLDIGEKIIVEYSIAFTAVGKYPNVATADAKGIESNKNADQVKKDVTISVSTNGKDERPTKPTKPTKPTTPPTTPPTKTSIPNPTVPLTPAPEAPVIIPESDVPLADVPQTGEDSNIAFNLAMLGVSLSALLTLLTIRRKKEQ